MTFHRDEREMKRCVVEMRKNEAGMKRVRCLRRYVNRNRHPASSSPPRPRAGEREPVVSILVVATCDANTPITMTTRPTKPLDHMLHLRPEAQRRHDGPEPLSASVGRGGGGVRACTCASRQGARQVFASRPPCLLTVCCQPGGRLVRTGVPAQRHVHAPHSG